MKTDLARPPARYRNEAVFRSAERLLASTPKKPHRKFPRWLVCSTGLLIGIGLAFVGSVLWRNAGPTATVTPAHSAAAASTSVLELTPHRRANTSASTSLPPAAAIPPATTSAPAEQPVSAGLPTPEEDRAWRTTVIPAFIAPATSTDSSAPETSASSVTTITRIVAEITLRGELRSATAAPVSIEFGIRRVAGGDGHDLVGIDRFLNGEVRFAAARVAGRLHGRTIMLRETEYLWTLNRPAFPVGRSFMIDLPEDAVGGEITGTWSFGSQRGTLVLAIVRPW